MLTIPPHCSMNIALSDDKHRFVETTQITTKVYGNTATVMSYHSCISYALMLYILFTISGADPGFPVGGFQPCYG